MSKAEIGTAPIPAPRDGAEYVGGAPDNQSRKWIPQTLRKKMFEDTLLLASEGLGYHRIIKTLKEKYGVAPSKSTISCWVRGIYSPYYQQRSKEERKKLYVKALKLHAEGYDYRTIAWLLSVSPTTVRDWLSGKYSPFGLKPPEVRPKVQKTDRRPQKVLEPCPELSYVIGAVLGDGSVYIYRGQKYIKLSVKNKEFADEVARCLSAVLGRPVRVRRWRDFFEVRVYSAALYNLLRKDQKLLERVKNYIEHCENCVAAFIRGFADAEGHVDCRGHVTLINSDYETLCYIKKLFKRIGVKIASLYLHAPAGTPILDSKKGKIYRTKKDVYALRTSSKSAHIFYEKVGLTITQKRLKLERYLKRRKKRRKKHRKRRKPHPRSLPPCLYWIGLPLSTFIPISAEPESINDQRRIIPCATMTT